MHVVTVHVVIMLSESSDVGHVFLMRVVVCVAYIVTIEGIAVVAIWSVSQAEVIMIEAVVCTTHVRVIRIVRVRCRVLIFGKIVVSIILSVSIVIVVPQRACAQTLGAYPETYH